MHSHVNRHPVTLSRLHLVHRLTQLHTRHARLHAQLLHARLHAMLLHDELHQPVHRLHVRRSSPLLDAIRNGTATPSATTDRLTSSTRRLSDATNPLPMSVVAVLHTDPSSSRSTTHLVHATSRSNSTLPSTAPPAHQRAPRSSSYAVYVLHALRATSQSIQSITATYSRRASLFDFMSPPDVRLRS
ncbi:hypothetical protein AAVH_10119 [Aphelenchoides avenae]|nr:hypothetical protein AAVH_10119 [Aphelenchus avenae]